MPLGISDSEVSAVTQYSVLRSAPPKAQATAQRPSVGTRCVISPPGSTRMKALASGQPAHTAPSASRQMPSGV